MTPKFKMPTDEEMPTALAELMGWELELTRHRLRPNKDSSWIMVWDWHTMTDRNHSRLAVEECERLGLQYEYVEALSEEVMPNRAIGVGTTGGSYVTLDTFKLATAKPDQESRAAYKTIWRHYNKETK